MSQDRFTPNRRKPDQGRRSRNLALLLALLAAVALFYVVAVIRMGQD